jgi:hypothetical protein
MKTSMKHLKFYLIITLLFALSSCTTYNFTTGVLVPADITISQDIQTVGVLNRSLPERSNLLLSIAESFLSGESIFGDREGSMNAIRGVANTLNVNPRFRAVLMEGEDYKGTGTKKFPIPLAWGEVDQLCKKYNVDAIISLETFDSDIFIGRNTREKSKKVDGKTVKYIEHIAELRIRVNAGWRFYDNVNKRMIDEQVFWDEKAWTGAGNTPEEALRRLPAKRRAINDAAIFSGEMLAFRVSPKWVTVNRTYFQKGKKQENFKLAKNKVKDKQWNEAAKLMDPLTRLSNHKIAARAMHNMAISAEMEGNIELAIEWATKAYKTHKRDVYREYVNDLHRRQMDQVKLDEQLEGK